MPRVSGLYCYPVKSCRGVSLSEAALDERGIVHDREFMVVDAENRCMTQARDAGTRQGGDGAIR